MKFRFIELRTHNAAMNMAIDHAILKSVSNGGLPTIRFYKWSPRAVTIGAYQNHKEINLEYCKKNKIDVVRRITGGGSIFHSTDDFTYSFIAPISILGNNIADAYRIVCSPIINALREIKINAVLKNKNDIIVRNKKISGNAAKIENSIYFQHGTLIYDLDKDKIGNIFKIKKSEMNSKVTGILEHKDITPKNFYNILKSSFIYDKKIIKYTLSKKEFAIAKYLAFKKYKVFEREGIKKFKGSCYLIRGDI